MRAQGSAIPYVAVMVIGVAVLAAATSYNTWKDIGHAGPADVRASAYLEKYSEPDCTFEGSWHDWEHDKWMTLGCLQVKDGRREGRYSSTTGPRAVSQMSIRGTYGIDGEGFIHLAGQDGDGKKHEFSAPISVENSDFPTQVCFAETTEGIACTAFFIWKKGE